MLDVLCYAKKQGGFDGPCEQRWIQIFLNEHFEDEFDVESPYFFQDVKENVRGVPVFQTEIVEGNLYKLKEMREVVKKTEPKLILVSQYEVFEEVLECSDEEQITSVQVCVTEERKLIHYTLINEDSEKILLVAYNG